MTKHSHGEGPCREIFERLSELIDGELDAGMCKRIDGHMGDCEPCRAFLESLRRTVRWVESFETPPLPDDVRRRIAEACARLDPSEL